MIKQTPGLPQLVLLSGVTADQVVTFLPQNPQAQMSARSYSDIKRSSTRASQVGVHDTCHYIHVLFQLLFSARTAFQLYLPVRIM